MNFNAAVEAHLSWTVHFRQAIRGHHAVDVAAIGSPHCCPLGEWLREVAQPHCAHLESYHACLRHHAAFHREAARIAEAAHARGRGHAETLMAPASPFTEASGMLMLHLNELRRQVKGLR